MVDLYRFMKKEYIDSFMSGNLYMNSLGYYWAHGFESQRDIMEGIVRMQDPSETSIPEIIRCRILNSVRYRLEAYKYCNLLCMRMHRYDPKKRLVERFDRRMYAFGEYAIRIIDIDAFLTRIFDKAKEYGDFCLAGPVNYIAEDMEKERVDCFDKMKKFEWQREWRVAYIHDYNRLTSLASENPARCYEEPYALRIGDISNIAQVVSTRDIVEIPQKIYKGYKIVETVEPTIWPEEYSKLNLPIPYQWSADEYRGWKNREEFQRKVIGIDGGKSKTDIQHLKYTYFD